MEREKPFSCIFLTVVMRESSLMQTRETAGKVQVPCACSGRSHPCGPVCVRCWGMGWARGRGLPFTDSV